MHHSAPRTCSQPFVDKHFTRPVGCHHFQPGENGYHLARKRRACGIPLHIVFPVPFPMHRYRPCTRMPRLQTKGPVKFVLTLRNRRFRAGSSMRGRRLLLRFRLVQCGAFSRRSTIYEERFVAIQPRYRWNPNASFAVVFLRPRFLHIASDTLESTPMGWRTLFHSCTRWNVRL